MPIMHPDYAGKPHTHSRLSAYEMQKHLALNEASRIEHEAASKRTLIITALAIGFAFVLWRQS